jgi:mono/diheme cytochrome c family protein
VPVGSLPRALSPLRKASNARIKALAAAVSACAVVGAAVGCSPEDEDPNLNNGKALFVQKCASCHNLARANSEGKTVGPDLDSSFAAATRDGEGRSTIEGIVAKQIENPIGPQMPADLVTGDDRRDVAAYVAHAAAKPGQDTGSLAQAGRPDERAEPLQAEGGKLNLLADPTGATVFVGQDQPQGGAVVKAEAPAGRLQLVMPNPASIPHNVALRGPGIQPILGEVVNKGGTSQVSATVKAGEYTFFCSVSGHEQGGMVGTLTVK